MSITMKLVGAVEYDEVMYAPGGLVYRWVQEVSNEMFFHMRREVPVNSRVNKTSGEPPVGTLSNLIFADVDQVGPRMLTIEAGSRAPYTQFVVLGTGTIYAKSGRIPKGEEGAGQFASIEEEGGMYLPPNPGFGASLRRRQVRGQKANNFIGRAYDLTARVHPALKGISME